MQHVIVQTWVSKVLNRKLEAIPSELYVPWGLAGTGKARIMGGKRVRRIMEFGLGPYGIKEWMGPKVERRDFFVDVIFRSAARAMVRLYADGWWTLDPGRGRKIIVMCRKDQLGFLWHAVRCRDLKRLPIDVILRNMEKTA